MFNLIKSHATSNYDMRHAGAVLFSVLVLGFHLVVSALIDHFGWLGQTPIPLSVLQTSGRGIQRARGPTWREGRAARPRPTECGEGDSIAVHDVVGKQQRDAETPPGLHLPGGLGPVPAQEGADPARTDVGLAAGRHTGAGVEGCGRR